ncbi:MAG: transaldolase family protein [candidate division WOR-3 bacterium]
MALFIDSAIKEEVKKLADLGLINGVTTNPKLLAQVKRPPQEVIRELAEVSPGYLFYQLTKETVSEMEREAYEFYEIAPKKIALKIPARTTYLSLIKKLRDKIPCAVTAVFSEYQGYLACELGAQFIIPYVNRSTRLQGDGISLVRRIRKVIETLGSKTEILAASIKTPDEAIGSVLAGASHLSLPYDLIIALGNHPLSEEAIKEFSHFAKE